MTQEEKDLLFRDLCARLPYKVWVECKMSNCSFAAKQMLNEYDITLIKNDKYDFYKPYLFPLSSMTEEQIKEFNSITQKCNTYIGKSIQLSDFCNKHHLDYRGLISMGLAIDATGLNIY